MGYADFLAPGSLGGATIAGFAPLQRRVACGVRDGRILLSSIRRKDSIAECKSIDAPLNGPAPPPHAAPYVFQEPKKASDAEC